MQVDAEPRYIPAARWRIFTRLYDPILALTMREKRFRAQMMERVAADLPSGGTALDVGCGTGTFALALAAQRPTRRSSGSTATPRSSAWPEPSPAPGQSNGRKGWRRSCPCLMPALTSSRSRSSSTTFCQKTSARRWPR
jgi:hypothetical protein